jgi:hypothetical protein
VDGAQFGEAHFELVVPEGGVVLRLHLVVRPAEEEGEQEEEDDEPK